MFGDRLFACKTYILIAFFLLFNYETGVKVRVGLHYLTKKLESMERGS